MKQLAKLDLYKVVIVASLLLLPAVGWWIKTTRASIEAAERALTEATKPDGLLEEIGKLQKQLRTVEENRASTSNQTGNSSTYYGNMGFSDVLVVNQTVYIQISLNFAIAAKD